MYEILNAPFGRRKMLTNEMANLHLHISLFMAIPHSGIVSEKEIAFVTSVVEKQSSSESDILLKTAHSSAYFSFTSTEVTVSFILSIAFI